MPNLRVLRYDEANPPRLDLHYGDDEAHYREKMRGAHDPKVWYAHKLGVEPLVPPVHPAVALTPAQFPKPLVVLSPFATRINRTWEVHNWRILARNLTQAGFNVIAIDGPNQPDRCREIGVKYFWGYAPEWVANVCHHANLIITGDSGLAHFGGWLGTPTLVIMSQQEPTKYYSMTHNQILRPNAACVECRFQPDRGYEEKCDFGCWALQSISPTTVTEQALAMLLNPQPKR
jgi:ADP-heptose:LPS heptosyltransferase